MSDTQRKTVMKIIQEYLKENGYDGLADGYECGCSIDDLCPCCSYGILCCKPAYRAEDGFYPVKTIHQDHPRGPCELPLRCTCGTIITEENVDNTPCPPEHNCGICKSCGPGKCPTCGKHWHCGGCL